MSTLNIERACKVIGRTLSSTFPITKCQYEYHRYYVENNVNRTEYNLMKEVQDNFINFDFLTGYDSGEILEILFIIFIFLLRQ